MMKAKKMMIAGLLILSFGIPFVGEAAEYYGCVDTIMVQQLKGEITGPDYTPPKFFVSFRLKHSGGIKIFSFTQLGSMLSGPQSYVPGERFEVSVKPQLDLLQEAAFNMVKVGVAWDDSTGFIKHITVKPLESCQPTSQTLIRDTPIRPFSESGE